MSRFKFRSAVLVLLLLAFWAALCAPASADPIPVKALVLAMFEIGENFGDTAGEFQHWYVEYFVDADSYDVQGAYSPLFVNKDGVAGTVTGMGKARSAATLMAILKDPRFDFSKTYFVVSGCSGVSPERGTLGDVFICDWVVDYDLGHSWKESDAEDKSRLFMLNDGFADNGSIQLNGDLAKWALSIVKGIGLEDSPGAVEYRKLYSEEAANSKPSVRTGTSMTGDNYWHGKGSSMQAFAICEAYGAPPYGVTQMEDNAFAIVLRSMGYLDRYLVVRDVVNFDQPHPGQTVIESLNATSDGFAIGMINGHRVGSAIVRHILANWPEWESGVPELK
ncbi:MAG: purine nucleoside permease [Synergistaceae bacterium]|nr:purine nucleoside permease [Synergistaceae bacterium]